MKSKIDAPSTREHLTNEKPSKKELVILVVEDSAMIRDLTCRMLSELGHSSIEATCAEHAMKLLKKERADLVITDHSMKQMTGLELIGYLKKVYPTIPAILASGHNTSLAYPEVLSLSKPFFLEDLKNAIQRALPNHFSNG
ncbi:response regulator [Stutzerimonas chloritidismutans]|uniref:Response regulator n=1 Tax=Stutzerimonas chloritidismutans TaxID=203192 RepID=A0ACC5VGF9_STUCH|nr:response regulator [Stutzerimonas chloritidismutans]MBX7271589.1 response regulator [Stutzerimonas chloritidismutans]